MLGSFKPSPKPELKSPSRGFIASNDNFEDENNIYKKRKIFSNALPFKS